MEDEVMARVTAAVQRGQAGERAEARQELEAMWAEVEQGGGDDFHRRLGDADRAHEFLEKARATSDALGDDAYGELVRGILHKVSRALAENSTDALPID